MKFNLLLIPILLIGAWFRFHTLSADIRFSTDEALFASFARDAVIHGDWLLQGDLDKPPLSLYASAFAMHFTAAHLNADGVLDFSAQHGEFAARLPATFAHILLIALTYALIKRLYADPAVAWWGAAFLALSPLAIAYSPSALTDGLMIPLGVAALFAASLRRNLLAGICLALAFAAKQQAVYFLPLLVMLVLLYTSHNPRQISASLLRLISPLLLMLALLWVWDALRESSPSFFTLASANNDPRRLIRSDEVLSRLIAWLGHGRFMLGAPTTILALFIPFAVLSSVSKAPRQRPASVDLLLLTYVLGYIFVHWLVAFNVYDRYLLIILPIWAILSARSALWVWRTLRQWIQSPELVVLAGAVLLSMLTSASAATNLSERGYNVEPIANRGIIGAAQYLDELPVATIIYNRWLGWELGYYLPAWSDKRLVYYPTPQTLAQGAAQNAEIAPRYLIAPSAQPLDVWLFALAEQNFFAEVVYQREGILIYRLTR